MTDLLRRALSSAPAVALAAGVCAGLAVGSAQAQSVWIFGERHDHPDHAKQTAEAVRTLARESRLRALVIEMAERGRSTSGLGAQATEADVRESLGWQEGAWPWAQYAPLVMAAVRSGAPVWGGNLPRAELRAAMSEPQWDERVPAQVHARLIDAVREGHCDVLPASQLVPMARVQIARDEQMARAVTEAVEGAAPGQVVVLHAGAAHASRLTGVPVHLARLAPSLPLRVIGFDSAYASAAEPGFDEWRAARHVAPRDHCAELRARGMMPPAAAPSVPGVAPAAPPSSPSASDPASR